MTKLRNRYTEDIACVLCFPRGVFRTIKEFIRGRSENCAASFLSGNFRLTLTVKQVHPE